VGSGSASPCVRHVGGNRAVREPGVRDSVLNACGLFLCRARRVCSLTILLMVGITHCHMRRDHARNERLSMAGPFEVIAPRNLVPLHIRPHGRHVGTSGGWFWHGAFRSQTGHGGRALVKGPRKPPGGVPRGAVFHCPQGRVVTSPERLHDGPGPRFQGRRAQRGTHTSPDARKNIAIRGIAEC